MEGNYIFLLLLFKLNKILVKHYFCDCSHKIFDYLNIFQPISIIANIISRGKLTFNNSVFVNKCKSKKSHTNAPYIIHPEIDHDHLTSNFNFTF